MVEQRKLTTPELSILRLYGPDTYCIDLGSYGPERVKLENAGLIRWVPGQGWSGYYTYEITDAGRAALNQERSNAGR
jgi:hypothetical protein